MIKLNYRTLNSEAFNLALQSLSSQSGFANFDTAYKIAKIVKQVADELKRAIENYQTLVRPFLVTDEAGNYKIAEKRHPSCPWEIKDGMTDEFNTMLTNFLNREVTIYVEPIKTEGLGQIKLSPAHILALQVIFDPSVFEVQESL